MPEITFEQAKGFLEKISPEDNVLVIHHDDGDGFCSGVLYYDWCKQKGAKTKQFTYSIGKSSLDEINLEEFNKVIVCDLAPTFMSEELGKIKDKQVLYADHHPRETPIPEEVLELVTVDQGYLPSSRTAGELTGIKPWLALTGTITDAGDLYPENEEFIEENLKKINMNLEEFKEKISSVLSNSLIYFEKNKKNIFEELEEIKSIEEIKNLEKYSEKVEEEIQKIASEYEDKKERLGDINFYYFEPEYSIKSAVSNIISRKNDDEAFIFATPKSGTDKFSISGRSQNRKRNMSELLQKGISGLENARAGGHPGAAGGILNSEDLEKFKQNIRNSLNDTTN